MQESGCFGFQPLHVDIFGLTLHLEERRRILRISRTSVLSKNLITFFPEPRETGRRQLLRHGGVPDVTSDAAGAHPPPGSGAFPPGGTISGPSRRSFPAPAAPGDLRLCRAFGPGSRFSVPALKYGGRIFEFRIYLLTLSHESAIRTFRSLNREKSVDSHGFFRLF